MCYRYRPSHRLRNNAEFRRVYSAGHCAADERLVVYACPNERCLTRLGISVGKKLGSAVRRNRYKRTLREAFRLNRHVLPTGYDYVLIPRPCDRPSSRSYGQSLLNLAKNAVRRCRHSQAKGE